MLELVDEERRTVSCTQLPMYLQYTAAAISMILGGALFFAATIWLAQSDTKYLDSSTDVAFTLGILTGILQLGSTLILCLMGLRAHWVIFFWLSFVSFLGSLTMFIFAIIEKQKPDDPNYQELETVENWVIVISSLDFAYGLLFLIISLIEIAIRNVTKVPYDILE